MFFLLVVTLFGLPSPQCNVMYVMELRMWLCEAIHCAQYFSVILLVRQLLLFDMACIREYAEGELRTRRIMIRFKSRRLCGALIDWGYGQFCLGECICESSYQRSQEARQGLAL